MKITPSTGRLRTLRVTTVLRPWRIYAEGYAPLEIPTDLEFLAILRRERGSAKAAKDAVVRLPRRIGGWIAVRWTTGTPTTSGRICADSFGAWRFEEREEAQDVLDWHRAWERKDAEYQAISARIAMREREHLERRGLGA